MLQHRFILLGRTQRRYGVVTILLVCRTRRAFSTTFVQRATHYDTLSVPRNASKSQIKSAYYKFSMQFHPDINKDPQAKEKFLAFSEAYTVLGDDRQRRLYDRSFTSPGVAPGKEYHPPGYHPYPTYSHYTTVNEARRRSANYAWERRHRPPPGSNPYPYPSTQRPQPSGDPHFRRAAGTLHYHPPRTDWKETKLDRVNRVSGLGRAAQLVGLLVVVAFVGTLGKS
ncbi:DnaJ domain-containing protein [Multifurca ochricompacta]|uniref:DnaJ domain-containing protein n=1 Tax=Multifurca ochricompacta TaxID=376703 RepID=A0AAD4M2D8_9AGAM|nr:DnaJ domain-containing protein [Multifurca ochricompacta]